ncbi:hypothetical protein Syun_013908 [Stephania yunnanensis]|uniref:Uncharacterized protein n=1 Tax=Stephania yunnanensis TaxID=152371 RepID=A0AAP0JI85_9MAGN
MPSSTHAKPLIRALDEAFEILYYNYQRTNVLKTDEIKRDLLRIMFENIEECIPVYITCSDETDSMNFGEAAMQNIIFGFTFIDVLSMLVREEGIEPYYKVPGGGGGCRSIASRDVHVGISAKLEQLFIGALCYFLRQLFSGIAKDVNETPNEEHEGRAVVAFKLDANLIFFKIECQYSMVYNEVK